MSKNITIRIHDEVNITIVGLPGEQLQHLVDEYSLFASNYFFNPKYKLGRWDGKISHFSKSGQTFLYLLPEILNYLVRFKFNIVIDDQRDNVVVYPDPIDENIFSHVIHPDTGKPIVLRDYQIAAVNELLIDGNGICLAATSAGKALSMDANILTPLGWIKNRDVKVGDVVITPDNKTANVIGVYPQQPKQLWNVVFHDGATVECCEEHLWDVYAPRKYHTASTERKIINTTDIINFISRKKSGIHTPGHISIPTCSPIEFEKQLLPIDPYLLGALLGDGTLSNLTMVFSNQDIEILDEVNSRCEPHDVKLHKIPTSNCDYRIIKNEKQNSCPPSPNNLKTLINDLGVNVTSQHKFIPSVYKNSLVSDRWSIIRGLFDTDGTVDKRGNISFTTISKQLATDVQEIVWSLGGCCTITSRYPEYSYKNKKKIGKLAYTCFVQHETPINFFNTSIKKDRCKKVLGDRAKRRIVRRIVDIYPTKFDISQCIMIDHPAHLYITDNYIVTHNTIICAAILYAYTKYNIKTITIVPDQTLILQTIATYSLCELDVGEYSGKRKTLDHQHIVSTWQALQHNPMLMNGFDLIIVDEAHNLRGPVIKNIVCNHSAKTPYRFGVTGTLPKEPIDDLAVKIAVGSIKYEIPAHKLISCGVLADLDIQCVQLVEDLQEQYVEYEDECKKTLDKPVTYKKFKHEYFPDFSAEKSYLQHNTNRLQWIAQKMCTERDKKGNVLCLVTSIPVARKLTELIPNAICVNGQDVKDPKKRQLIYDMFETHNDLIVIATVNIAGTGLSINRIFSLFSVDLGKSFTRVIQAIGRSLRTAYDKKYVTVFDICSDLKYGSTHLNKRVEYYKEAKYNYKIQKLNY